MPHHVSDERGPFGRNVEASARIRSAIRAAGLATPVVVTGGVHGFAQAEELLASDRADVVGFARQSLADPDWFTKVRSGHGDAVNVCIYANYCEALDEKHEEVTCQLWDRVEPRPARYPQDQGRQAPAHPARLACAARRLTPKIVPASARSPNRSAGPTRIAARNRRPGSTPS